LTKKLQSQIVSRIKQWKTLLHKKAAHKMLVKLTPGEVFHQHFTRAFFVQKSSQQLFSSYILAKKHFRTKKARVKGW